MPRTAAVAGIDGWPSGRRQFQSRCELITAFVLARSARRRHSMTARVMGLYTSFLLQAGRHGQQNASPPPTIPWRDTVSPFNTPAAASADVYRGPLSPPARSLTRLAECGHRSLTRPDFARWRLIELLLS